MAPEVFEIPQDEIDNGSMEPSDPRALPFKADVYSFAIVCSEILTGKQPFPDVRLGRLIEHIRDGGRPELPDGCPRRLVSLIERCWELEPRRRPDFPEICRELRYIKGLLLAGSAFFSQNTIIIHIDSRLPGRKAPLKTAISKMRYLQSVFFERLNL
jgi:serine/threonine protein kinase